MRGMSSLTEILRRHPSFEHVIDVDLTGGAPLVFDFTGDDPDLHVQHVADGPAFTAWLDERLANVDPAIGVGRYDEDRMLYRHSPLFDGATERRSLHLGIDLFAEAGTPVHAPLDAVVHSFADNTTLGDYGPTVILEHELESVRFWTLYGHLDRLTLKMLHEGQVVPAGAPFGALGDLDENGGWPPHLHFQVIADIGTHRGDYPGVAAPSERRAWLDRCPDPNLILRIPGL